MNKKLRDEQMEKLRALIGPLSEAMDAAPADPETEDQNENVIWGMVNFLLASLQEFFDKLAGAEAQEEAQQAESIKKLLEELAEGKCPGVKGATAYKIQKFAAERGYV